MNMCVSQPAAPVMLFSSKRFLRFFFLIIVLFYFFRIKGEKAPLEMGCLLGHGAFVLHLVGQSAALCDCTYRIKVSKALAASAY